MDKNALLAQLTQQHLLFAQTLAQCTDAQLKARPPEDESLHKFSPRPDPRHHLVRNNVVKWTTGQHLSHIYLSVKPVSFAFGLPKWALGWLFGKANRPSISYEALIEKYLQKLAQGGKATGPYVPKFVSVAKARHLTQKLPRQVERLVARAQTCTEAQLDAYVVPHPLLGKLTLREVLMFTLYHVQHHHQVLKNQYLAANKHP